MTASEPNLPDDFSEVEEISRSSGWLRVTLEITVAVLILVGIYYLFAPAEDIDLPPLQHSEIDPIIRAEIEAANEAKPAPLPPASGAGAEASLPVPTTPEPSVEQTAEAPVLADGDAAREIIAAQRSGTETRSPSDLASLGSDYQQQGHPTDAYLLWFYAARQGDGTAAFALADLYDPNHFQSGNSLVTEADATQAYKWYSAASRQSVPQAGERLQALRLTLEEQAKAGDTSARRMLLNWQ